MLSRVADSLYWMSRYLERAEYTSRTMGVHLNLMLEHDIGSGGSRWPRVVTALGSQDKTDGEDFAAAESYGLSQIVNSIGAARENARQVREQISSEMWEELNRLFHESKRIGAPERFRAQPFDLVHTACESAHLFHGITDSTMLHGEGWQFIQAGRFIERVQHTARLVDAHFEEFHRPGLDPASAAEHMEWLGLLRSCTAFEAYCKVYTAELRPERVAEFLLLNAEFPHSVRFGVERLGRALDAINQATARKSDRLAKQAGRLAAALSYTPLEEIMSSLHEFSANIRRLCGQIHAGIYQVYIAYPIEAALGA
ncbi:MAG TPA: alpha-E domain-containing protein [Bryobacteraceae bacterium]|nr:alpha-E domain-containing protein [Bryobacteraceae bacterium]